MTRNFGLGRRKPAQEGPTLAERMTPRTRDEAPPRKRSALRVALHALSTVLMVSGALLLLDAGLTVVWQEPLSAAYNSIQQSKLSAQLEHDSQRLAPTVLEKRALQSLPDPSSRVAFAARALDRKAQEGQAIGRIVIDALGLNKVIVEGTEEADLQKGPGHYPDQPMPGAPGTVAIAGHRTTYGAPFNTIDQLDKGDRIELRMPYATVTYQVFKTDIVAPTDTYVTERQDYDQLILTACHPLYSAAQRIVVFAKEVHVTPSASISQ